MKKNILCLLLICSISTSLFAQYDLKDEYHIIDFDHSQLDQAVTDIVARFGWVFNYGGTGGNEVNEERIRSFLLNVLDHSPIDKEPCNPGTVWFTNEEYKQGGPYTDVLFFGWDGAEMLNQYYGTFLDLINNEEVEVSTTDRPGSIFPNVEYAGFKLFALNARCISLQSPYFIIIVEKDITFQGMYNPGVNGMPGNTPPVGLGGGENSPAPNPVTGSPIAGIKVFPNPTADQFRIQFKLDQESATSLHLINSTSGAIIQDLIPTRHLDAGIHTYQFPTASLSSGLYHLVLQTANQREVKRLTVVK